METKPEQKGFKRLLLLGAAALVAAALLIVPYIGGSPVGTAVGQEQAPAAPADQPAAPAAPAPSVGEELGAGRNVSLNLMLRSARIVRVDLDDKEEELVEFTFNGDLQEILNKDAFMLLGPNPDNEAISESAVLDETSPNSVLIGFKSGTDVRSFSLAAVKTGAVSSRDGKVNLQATAGLAGSTGFRGPTAAPALLWASITRSKERISYVFDKDLDENLSFDPQRFGYYTRSGNMHLGDTLISIEKRVATIEFKRADGDNVEDAVRFFVLAGAVKDLQGHDGTPRAVGGRTSKPDLSSVRRIADTMFDYTFDASVTEVDPKEFTVYTATGKSYQGDAYARPDADTVRVIFPQLRYVGDQIVLAAVSGKAVKSAESITSQNTVGAMRLAPAGRNNGGTAGPDLTSVDMDDDTGLVTYHFDEALDHRFSLDKIDPRNFMIISSAGDLLSGISVAWVGTNSVSILFNKDDVEDAQAAAMKAGAVTDDEGNANPIGSVLR